MKIISSRTICVGNPWKNWIYVVLETDEGISGIGEATGGLSTRPIEAAVKEMQPLYVGLDPRDVTGVVEALAKGTYFHSGPAVAGIELACWDILGKSLDVPVWRLLGGKVRDRIPAYANGWYQGPREPEFFAARASEVTASGYRALKFDPFGDAYRSLDRAEMHRSLALVEAVRTAVPDDTEIMIEAHDRFDVGTAIEVGRALASFGISWLEAPVLSTDANAVGRVVHAVGVPVAAGERCTALHEMSALLDAGIAVAQPEVLQTGLLNTHRMAAVAESKHVSIAPHNAQSPMSTVINLHLAAVIPNFRIQEHFDDFAVDWAKDLIHGSIERDGADLLVPHGAGFGVTLDESIASDHGYSPQNFLRLFKAGWERRNSDDPSEMQR